MKEYVTGVAILLTTFIGTLMMKKLDKIIIVMSLLLIKIRDGKTYTNISANSDFISSVCKKINLKVKNTENPGGIYMHRAIGIPLPDNSSRTIILNFE